MKRRPVLLSPLGAIWRTACLIVLIAEMSGPGAAYYRKVPKMCSKQDVGSLCEVKSAGDKVICRNEYEPHYRKEYWKANIVVLCSWSDWYLNPEEILGKFPIVKKLVVANGNVTEFLTDFPVSEYLETLILSNLLLEDLRLGLFASLINLKLLDLTENRLKNIHPSIVSDHSSLKKVILTDNPWDCTSNLKWILNRSINDKLINTTQLLCCDNLYPGKPVYSVMFLIAEMERECPQEICICSMVNIVWDTSKSYLVPVITVNCSGKGLQDIPDLIPKSTTSLILNRNNITSLLPLVKKKVYSNVPDIYLDYNNIKNIDVLEGALWLTQFRVLSLKGNFLTQLPAFALDNAFERNANMAKLYLGDNPWKCDCMFTSEFQHLLIKYRSIVKDRQDIKCSIVESDDSSLVPVIDISISSVCTPASHEINPLDVLSGVFAFLIAFVVGKLIYDYWTFKRTGKLPWIVAKMP